MRVANACGIDIPGFPRLVAADADRFGVWPRVRIAEDGFRRNRTATDHTASAFVVVIAHGLGLGIINQAR